MKERPPKPGDASPGNTKLRSEEILEDNTTLLVQNIILTDDVLDMLLQEQVLPASALRDIKTIEDRVDRNKQVVTDVSKRGEKVFRRFCHVLDKTGHRFLSLHLNRQLDKLPDADKESTDVIFKKFPELGKTLRTSQQKALIDYINEKVRDDVIAGTWKGWTAEADMAVAAINRGLEDEMSRDAVTKQLQEQVATLTAQLQEEKAMTNSRKAQIEDLQTRMDELKAKHENAMKSMISSFDASERANTLANERMSEFDDQVKAMSVNILRALHEEDPDPESVTANNHIKTGRVDIEFLEKNIALLIQCISKLRDDICELNKNISKEREKVFNKLKVTDQGQTLAEAFVQSIVSTTEIVEGIESELSKINHLLRVKREPMTSKEENVHCDPGGDASDALPTTEKDKIEEKCTEEQTHYQQLHARLHEIDSGIQTIYNENKNLLEENSQQSSIIDQKLSEIEDLQRKLASQRNTSEKRVSPNQWKDKHTPLPPITPRTESKPKLNQDTHQASIESPEVPQPTPSTEAKRLKPVSKFASPVTAGRNRTNFVGQKVQYSNSGRRNGQMESLTGLDNSNFIVKQISMGEHKKY